jgi:hypothetical protein
MPNPVVRELSSRFGLFCKPAPQFADDLHSSYLTGGNARKPLSFAMSA